MKKTAAIIFGLSALLWSAACTDDPEGPTGDDSVSGTEPVLAEEYYAGGELGTAFNTTSVAYEQPTPVVDADAMMTERFLDGEALFEHPYHTGTTGVRRGLGPLYIRTSCLHCHPGYGHGQRISGTFDTNQVGNGYLLVISDEDDNYLTSLTGMPQTQAVEPFKAPIDESRIRIDWPEYTDEWGNRFPDGESYSLIYPVVTIPEEAYYVPLIGVKGEVPYANVRVRLESTIGIYGTGLLDAIDDDDLKAEYARQEEAGVELNPAIFRGGDWVKTYNNTGHPLRFTYALSRGPLQDAAGANAMWNITNVTRSDRRYHYMTTTYAEVASKDPDVQADFYRLFPEWNRTGDVERDIYDYLMNQELPVEMSDDDYVDFMVWHRGLAVPAARNLDDPEVQRGKELFTQMGCVSCHRPTWTTGDDVCTDPNGFFTDGDNRLPRYPHQKIWPYSDLVQHRLHMVNDIRTGWCRTTPLWGRGLSRKCTGADDRLHDCRARTVIEAIMWHGAPESDARWTVERFRELSKQDRDAVVKFIESI